MGMVLWVYVEKALMLRCSRRKDAQLAFLPSTSSTTEHCPGRHKL